MQKPAQVCKSTNKYAKACKSIQKHILSKTKFDDIFFLPFFKFYNDFFPSFFKFGTTFLKKQVFATVFRQLLMVLLTIFYGFLDNFYSFFVLLFLQYKIRLAQYKSLITFLWGGCKSLS
jgi:hypothetical protein